MVAHPQRIVAARSGGPENQHLIIYRQNGYYKTTLASPSYAGPESTHGADWRLPSDAIIHVAMTDINRSDAPIYIDGHLARSEGNEASFDVAIPKHGAELAITHDMILAGEEVLKSSSTDGNSYENARKILVAAAVAGGVSYFFPDHDGAEE